MKILAANNKKRMTINHSKNYKMIRLLIFLLAVIISCTNTQPAKQLENKKENDNENPIAIIPAKTGIKLKADEATRKNVAAMVQLINDTSYQNAGKRKELSVFIQNKIDTLVNQCSMKGAEHDALHVWLEQLLLDVKKLKGEHDEYTENYAAVKKDVESFYEIFE